MPSNCAVFECKNSSKTEAGKCFSYHSFPVTDPKLCKRWVELCKRKDPISIKNARICSQHFQSSDYERDLRNELLNLPIRKILKSGTVPSIFPLRNKLNKENVVRNKRGIRIQHQSVIEELLDSPQHNTQPISGASNLISAACQTTNYLKSNYYYIVKQTHTFLEINLLSKMINIELFSCADLEKQLLVAKRKLWRQQAKILKLTTANQTLRKRMANLKSRKCSATPHLSSLTKTQENRLVGKKVNWTTEDLIKAMTVRSASLKAYETVQKIWKFPLPSARTLRRYAANFNCKPGILLDVLEILKNEAASMEPWRKICSLTFDEMSLSSQFIYDKVDDCILSNSKVQVVMIRGICDNWKQPIYFNFDTKMTKSLLFDIILAVENSGFSVWAVTSDMGAENRALWKELSIQIENSKFRIPSIHRDIHVFADIPHMLKLIRNHVLDDGVQLDSGTQILKSTFENALKANSSELLLCPKFTIKHLEVVGAERMRVRPAAQLLSNHVATLCRKVFDNQEIFTFIKTINDGFDVLNSRVKQDDKNLGKSALGFNFDDQVQKLHNLKQLMMSCRFLLRDKKSGNVKPKNVLLPCQTGFVVSINSVLNLFSDLRKDFPNLFYLLTSRLNQDCLESFFSRIRAYGGSNTNPTAVEFRYRLRLILLGSQVRAPVGTNSEFDGNINLISAKLIAKNKLVNLESNATPKIVPVKILRKQKVENYDNDSLFYLAGYIAWQLKRKGKGIYGYPTKNNSNGSWIEMLSRGGLLTPTDKMHSWILECNQVFDKLIKQNFNYSTPGLMKFLIANIKNSCPNIEEVIIKEFVKIRIKIRTRYFNINRSNAINLRKAKQFLNSKAVKH